MRVVAAVALAVAVGMLTACGGSSDEGAVPPTTTTSTPTSSDREKAPVVEGTSLGGDAVGLGDFRGRPVLVNVWSSW